MELAEMPVDVNDVIEHLLQLISGQVLQIAKLEALSIRLMRELRELKMWKIKEEDSKKREG